MGSKAKITKYICPIIQRFIDVTKADVYIEPFVGGANVIDKIVCNNRVGSDINRYLIELLKYAQQRKPFPENILYDEYCKVRDCYNSKSNDFEDWYIGLVGFLASYNGRFFDGGFAKPTVSGGKLRNYYREHLGNLLSQNLTGIDFRCCDYSFYKNVENSVIYCDPPYANTKKYNNRFDFDIDEFCNFVRNVSTSNIVLISEQSAPDDFICIWKQIVKRQINTKDKFDQTEKLFVHKSLCSKYDIDSILNISAERKLF